MKKLFLYLFLISLTLILTACSGEDNENTVDDSTNLINIDMVTEGSWVDGKGDTRSNPEMYMTEKIAYNTNEDYNLSRNAYVSFYEDEQFLKTVRYQGGFSDFPFILENVENSNNIIISFNNAWLDEIELIKK